VRLEMRPSVIKHRLPNGFEVECHNVAEVDSIYREIFVEERYLRSGITLSPGMSVIDGGAHVGLFTLFAAPRVHPGPILAVEPSPRQCAVLRQNLRALDNVIICEAGLAGRNGNAQFRNYLKLPAMSGILNFVDEASDRAIVLRSLTEMALDASVGTVPDDIDYLADRSLEWELEDISVVLLNDLIDECGWERVDLLKLDIQGAELEVLDGLQDAHWAKIGQLAGEIHDCVVGSASRRDLIISILERHGFLVATAQDETFAGTNRYAFAAVRR
jgi:L-glutamate---[L-glutamyl-carrier protein] ligase